MRERERERRSDIVSTKKDNIQSITDNYSNINLLDNYLDSLHDKVLPSCNCCK